MARTGKALYGLYYDKQVFNFVRDLANKFPEVRATSLGFIGKRGAELLYGRFLRGQEIKLRVFPFDRIGRRTVSYSIGKRAGSVKIGAYPANFFEKGRRLRSGRREPGRHIIKRKFKTIMNTRLPGFIKEFDQKFLEDELNKVVKDRTRNQVLK